MESCATSPQLIILKKINKTYFKSNYTAQLTNVNIYAWGEKIYGFHLEYILITGLTE